MSTLSEEPGPVRIAMWSGPRNLSTAMMRSFGARADCTVWDEPFFAPYLDVTGVSHPMRAEVLAAHERDPGTVSALCAGSGQGAYGAGATRRLFYQKHMTHHMVDGFDLSFMAHTRPAFLIRDPAEVVASYEIKREAPTLADIGLERQLELFEREADRLGRPPPVLDARVILEEPRGSLCALCERLDIPFDEAMLAWHPGRRASDGAWAPHWYASVERSTGFAPPSDKAPRLSAHGERLAHKARPLYDRLRSYALDPRSGG